MSGKKALKKHVQRSIDKLVAAKEQLPEEEGREVAQGITERKIVSSCRRMVSCL